ncbi:3-oxoacyl-ACP reductase [Prodigiosinella confusarubida]|uniref:3-oxoacyl-ACP reductase n=1 Tax=Serratia sp. (strain ATCC 39006) TaxID=104623 RepID=A0A2I5T5W6_SERS3|nr:glucose 1-dehydrogenase [Serratia sp. ATCC 39006]AUG99962.1 3-oxoacyl-ACP reductase [Serratia sp. ATCC 39006]AUH04282.1 3-oxoacyl-ACP reductase [Serratia sp. ATCC 39006]
MMNKTALITGGATGIGKATAKKLISQGINVIISGRNIDKGAEAVKEIQKVATQGAIVEFIQNDVTDEQAVQSMINQIVEKFSQLDMAINNSGISNETASLNFSDSANFQAMLDTNVSGLYYCMKHEIVQMLKQGNGSIVNLASIAGLNGMPWAGTYAATKHAVVGLTKSAALDHAAQGIRINGVAPGATKTDIIAKQLDGSDENYNEEVISAMHPMNRLGKPEEIANGIAWLLSDEASFVTGHILNIDGGFQAK